MLFLKKIFERKKNLIRIFLRYVQNSTNVNLKKKITLTQHATHNYTSKYT